jgi:hypothetical protein
MRFELFFIEINDGRAILMPFFATTDLMPEVLSATLTLNTAKDFVIIPRTDFILSQGWAFKMGSLAGDGTRTFSDVNILFERIGERLVDLL